MRKLIIKRLKKIKYIAQDQGIKSLTQALAVQYQRLYLDYYSILLPSVGMPT